MTPHYSIAIIDLGINIKRCHLNLGTIIDKLNKIQSAFKYELYDPPVTDLGPMDMRHGYTDQLIFDILENKITGTNTCGIGITDVIVRDAVFDTHNGHLGLITIENYEDYIPTGRTLEQFVMYLILCETFCVIAGLDFEHDLNNSCLFDKCNQKISLKKCIRKPYICEPCKKELLRSGFFSSEEINESEKIIKYLSKPKLINVLQHSIINPLSGFFIGGILVGILTIILHDYFQNRPWIPIIIFSILFIISCLYWYYKPEEG